MGGAVVRTARAIAAAEGLPTDTVVEVAGLGSVNHVYVVGSGPDRWVVRFARDPRSPNVFASEAWSAERAARLGIPTPAPIRHGAVDGVAYAAYRYLSGRQVAEANVPHGWLDLASYGQRINSIQPDNSTPQSLFTRFGRDLQQAWTLHLEYNLELLDGSDPLLAAHAYTDSQQARFREAIHELATEPMSFGLSHGDMTLRNLLIRDSAPAALIDWGSASFGPVPWTDLLVLDQEDRDQQNATHAGFDSYLDALGLNSDTVRPVFERLRLLHLLDLIRWALDQRPDRIATAVTDLQSII